MKAIAGVLDHLSNFISGSSHRGIDALVKTGDDISAPRSLLADHSERRVVKVRDRTALPEKLWVKAHIKIAMYLTSGGLAQDRDQSVPDSAWQNSASEYHTMISALLAQSLAD